MNLEIITTQAQGSSKGDLVCLHGICTGAWVWQEHFAPYLAQAGYTTHALSLRGHGQSSGRSKLASATLADYTDDLASLAATLPNPVLIGHSLGGAIVQNYLRRGGDARGVALLASVPPWGLALAAARMAVTRPRLFAELSRMQLSGVAGLNPEVMKDALFSPSLPATTFQGYADKFTDESHLIGAELQGFRPFAPLPWQALPPVFVLGGESDQFIPADEISRTALYYGTTATLVPNLAHTVMLDTHWQHAATPLLTWLSKLT